MINEAHLDKETDKPILPPNYFVFVEGGPFMMGSDDEKPIHEVNVTGFYIARFLLTQKIYKEVMNKNPSFFIGDDKRPVECVSWDDAQGFCATLRIKTGLKYHYRLPTEAEWEYAAKGGNLAGKKKMIYAGSDILDEVGWYKENSPSETQPVGLKNFIQLDNDKLDIYDMSGNVWEWCNSRYMSYPYDGNDGRDNLGGIGVTRVCRGGSWNDDALDCRVTNRIPRMREYNHKNLGFRLALTLNPDKG